MAANQNGKQPDFIFLYSTNFCFVYNNISAMFPGMI